MVDRSYSERLRGFCDRLTDGLTDRQTDICDSRVAFATENMIDQISERTKIRYIKDEIDQISDRS